MKKVVKKMLAFVFAACLALGLVVTVKQPVGAGNGPSGVFDFIQLGYKTESEMDWKYIYDVDGEDLDTVSGVTYDKTSNTLTLNNFKGDNVTLSTNMMGDDFKLKVTGENTLSRIVVYGDSWGGNLEICGDGSLVVNKDKKSEIAIDMRAESTAGKIKIASTVAFEAYKGAEGKSVIAISNCTSASVPISIEGTLAEELKVDKEVISTTVSAYSGVESEDTSYFEICTKSGDDGKYAVKDVKVIEGQVEKQAWQIFKILSCEGLPSENDSIAVKLDTIEQDAFPAEYKKTGEHVEVCEVDNFYSGSLLENTATGEKYNCYILNNNRYICKLLGASYETTTFWGEDIVVDIVAVDDSLTLKGYSWDDPQPLPDGFEYVAGENLYMHLCKNDSIKVTPKTSGAADNTAATVDKVPSEAANKDMAASIASTDKGGTIKQEVVPNVEISKETIKAAKDKGQKLEIAAKSDSGATVATWSISSITKDVAFNPTVTVDAKVEAVGAKLTEAKLPETTKVTQVSFAHDGDLPGAAEVTLALPKAADFTEGSTVYLYYFNPTVKLFEQIDTAKCTGGKATFTMTHCSDYIVTSAELPANLLVAGSPGTGDGVNVALMGMIFFMGMAVIAFAKKREVF